MQLSVIIPSHNPRAESLQRALDGLRAQTLPSDNWELIIVDNGSSPAIAVPLDWHSRARIVRETTLGLTHARLRGFLESTGEVLVLVDDDNVLARNYFEHVARVFGEHLKLGGAGGRSLPEFEVAPPPWISEFLGLLACRDLGPEKILANGFDSQSPKAYPLCSPIGAGMAIRKVALQAWIQEGAATKLSDRRGRELSSGGDNDIVLTILESGWSVGYFPELSLTHLIPAPRLQTEYLARLNRAIARSWMQVLTQHQCNPWPPIPAWTAPLRIMKAWLTYCAWGGPVRRIRWRAACGHFEGRTPIR